MIIPPSLWYENDAGDRHVPDWSKPEPEAPPPGFKYQHSRFPFDLRHSILLLKEHDCERLAEGSDGVPASLVLALCRPSIVEAARQLLRYGRVRKRLDPMDAFMVAGVACEACMNALAWEHGLTWGYRRGSKPWAAARTSCELCRPATK